MPGNVTSLAIALHLFCVQSVVLGEGILSLEDKYASSDLMEQGKKA